MVELLRYRATQQGGKTTYTFLVDGETAEAYLTYGELDQRARMIAAWLQSQQAAGERVLLLYPPGLEYIAAFFGCLYAGCIAVPAYPPRVNRPDARLQAIANNSQATIALTDAKILAKSEERLSHTPELVNLQWQATDSLALELADKWRPIKANRNDLAFLQYTSGSIAMPKGVMVSHGNLLHNLELIRQAAAASSDIRLVSWLPFYHDMGLVTGVLQPVYANFHTTFLSPFDFLQRPWLWLQTISRLRATHSGGPNFAYELCLNKIRPEQCQNLDLSSWEVAFNGAEPVRLETLKRFAAAFEPYGFREEAFMPCYGLAESTVGVSWSLKTTLPRLSTIKQAALVQNQVISASPADEDAKSLVGCGQTPQDMKIVVVDPEAATLCPVGRIGEIWVSGPSVAQGYWRRPEETQDTFRAYVADTGAGPFLRTGDLGFLQDGELFITGRLKDLIIIRGRNYYPQDIELTVERSHPALQLGGGAAFTMEVKGDERLVVVQEVQRQYRNPDVAEVAQAIRGAVAEDFELQVYAVVLLKTGSLSKTSSG